MLVHSSSLIFGFLGLIFGASLCSVTLARFARTVKIRAEEGEVLATRFTILPLYETFLLVVAICYALFALLIFGACLMLTSLDLLVFTNFCVLSCEQFVPLRCHFSIWKSGVNLIVGSVLLVWVILVALVAALYNFSSGSAELIPSIGFS